MSEWASLWRESGGSISRLVECPTSRLLQGSNHNTTTLFGVLHSWTSESGPTLSLRQQRCFGSLIVRGPQHSSETLVDIITTQRIIITRTYDGYKGRYFFLIAAKLTYSSNARKITYSNSKHLPCQKLLAHFTQDGHSFSTRRKLRGPSDFCNRWLASGSLEIYSPW